MDRVDILGYILIAFTIFEGVLWPSKKNNPTTKAIAYPTPAAIIVFKVAHNI